MKGNIVSKPFLWKTGLAKSIAVFTVIAMKKKHVEQIPRLAENGLLVRTNRMTIIGRTLENKILLHDAKTGHYSYIHYMDFHQIIENQGFKDEHKDPRTFANDKVEEIPQIFID